MCFNVYPDLRLQIPSSGGGIPPHHLVLFLVAFFSVVIFWLCHLLSCHLRGRLVDFFVVCFLVVIFQLVFLLVVIYFPGRFPLLYLSMIFSLQSQLWGGLRNNFAVGRVGDMHVVGDCGEPSSVRAVVFAGCTSCEPYQCGVCTVVIVRGEASASASSRWYCVCVDV